MLGMLIGGQAESRYDSAGVDRRGTYVVYLRSVIFESVSCDHYVACVISGRGFVFFLFSPLSGRQHQDAVLARKTTLPQAVPGRGAQALAPRPPSLSLAGIVGAGARRRDDDGASRFGGNGAATFRPPSGEAKPLCPSVSRAAGRTTVLSSVASTPGGRSLARSSGVKGSQTRGAPSAGQSTATAGRGRVGGTSPKPAGKEDLVGLPWAYGSGGGGTQRGGATSTKRGAGDGGEMGGVLGGPGEKKRKRDGTAATGKRDFPGGGEGEGTRAARPPAEAHPAGYMDGTVVVPAQSRVFLTMPQRCGVRADGSRTNEGTKILADVQVCTRSGEDAAPCWLR